MVCSICGSNSAWQCYKGGSEHGACPYFNEAADNSSGSRKKLDVSTRPASAPPSQPSAWDTFTSAVDKQNKAAAQAKKEHEARQAQQLRQSQNTTINLKKSLGQGLTQEEIAIDQENTRLAHAARQHGSAGLLTNIALAGAAFVGIAVWNAEDKKPVADTSQLPAQPMITATSTLEDSFQKVIQISPENRVFFAKEDIEVSIPYIRDGRIYEYTYVAEEGSCFRPSKQHGWYINAIEGDVAESSPVKAHIPTIFGLANPRKILAGNIATMSDSAPCEVRISSIISSGTAAPSEQEIQAIIDHGRKSASYLITEDTNVYARRSEDSPVEYSFAKGSCLRVLSAGDGLKYAGSYKLNGIDSGIVYEGYVDSSKLAPTADGLYAMKCEAKTIDPIVVKEGPQPTGQLSYLYFTTTEDTELVNPYTRNGQVSEYNYFIGSGSCLKVEDLFTINHATTMSKDNLPLEGLFNPDSTRLLDASDPATKDCRAELLSVSQPNVATPTKDEILGFLDASPEDMLHTTAVTEVFKNNTVGSDMGYRLGEGSCITNATKVEGNPYGYFVGFEYRGNDQKNPFVATIRTGFIDLSKTVSKPADNQGCVLKLAP